MKALFVATLVWFRFRRLNYFFDDPDDVYWAWEKVVEVTFWSFWTTMLRLNRFDEDVVINFNL